MPTQTLTQKWTEGSATFAYDTAYTADGEINADISVPAGSTNLEVDIAWAIAKLQFLMLVCSKAVTIKTNSTGSPQETFSLTADRPLVYGNDDYRAAIFAGNVTKFYVTNASGVDATLKVRSVIDLTP